MNDSTNEGPKTLGDFGGHRLGALARAVGLHDETDALDQSFRQLLGPWAEAPVGGTPPWLSDVCDDHTPFEFSIAIGGAHPELRILVERRGASPNLASNQVVGTALNAELVRTHGADLERLHAIEDLFLRPDAQGVFAMWHAMSFSAGCAPECKLYLNLHAQGPTRAAAVAEAALERLGFPRAWGALAEYAMARGPELDVPSYLSLDLADRSGARVKVYFRHLEATVDDLERACSAAKMHVAGHVAEFCTTLGGEGPYTAKGLVTCFAYVEGDERPSASTIYFPIGAYAQDDRVARDRIAAYLTGHGLPVSAYMAPLEAFANRPLEAGVGMHSYASLRWVDAPRVTVYFTPEAYRVEPPRTAGKPVARTLEAAIEIVHHHEATPITEHPFFAHLARDPVNLGRLWKLLANFREGIVLDFPRRLASLTARIDDERIRSILAKQLNDEMGNGDFSRAHRGLFEHMLAGLEPFHPSDAGDQVVVPGHALGDELERLYVEADPYEGVGASLVVEVYGKQIDIFTASQFRRQNEVAPEMLEWLELHETLEVEHADEAMDLAKLISADKLAAAWRGAGAISAASFRFFDALHRRCFG